MTEQSYANNPQPSALAASAPNQTEVELLRTQVHYLSEQLAELKALLEASPPN